MAQDARIGTPGIFEGIAKDREVGEVPVCINALRQGHHGGGEPRGVKSYGTERVTNDVPE
jgi:hypothetical protein